MPKAILILVLALVPARAGGQDPDATRAGRQQPDSTRARAYDPDSVRVNTAWAWRTILEDAPLRLSYIFYAEADNVNDGVVLRIDNDGDAGMRYAFTVIFRPGPAVPRTNADSSASVPRRESRAVNSRSANSASPSGRSRAVEQYVEGWVGPRTLVTGDVEGLFFVPFPDGRSIAEIGVRGFRFEAGTP